jgi:hypothetical protein
MTMAMEPSAKTTLYKPFCAVTRCCRTLLALLENATTRRFRLPGAFAASSS